MTKHFLIVFILLTWVSCNRTGEIPSDHPSQIDVSVTVSITTLSGQVYFYAPVLDTVICEATGACDCCSGHFIFLNDSNFISMDYCESETIYNKGSYRILNGDLLITSDSISINKEYNPAREADPTGTVLPEYLVTDTLTAPHKQTLKRIACKNSVSFLMGDKEFYYVTRDSKTSLKDLIQTIKKDSIWDRLRIKNYR